jgi:predicted  nucleic acid-binding Zn-ribbon protein
VTPIRSRFAQAPHRCPFCGHVVHVGEVVAVVTSGSTYSSGCVDCAWAAFNGRLSDRREAA